MTNKIIKILSMFISVMILTGCENVTETAKYNETLSRVQIERCPFCRAHAVGYNLQLDLDYFRYWDCGTKEITRHGSYCRIFQTNQCRANINPALRCSECSKIKELSTGD